MSSRVASAKERLLRGRRLLHEGDVAAASWEVRQARHDIARVQGTRSVSYGIATLALGRVVAREGDWDEALMLGRQALCLIYTRELAATLAFADALALVGLALSKTDRRDEAVRYLEHASAVARLADEGTAFTLRIDRELGKVLLDLRRGEDAVEAFGRVWFHLYESEDATAIDLWETGRPYLRALLGSGRLEPVPEVILRLVDDCADMPEVWQSLLEVVRVYEAHGHPREAGHLLVAAVCLSEPAHV